MNHLLRHRSSTAPIGLQLAVCGAALVLAATVFALWDRHSQSLPIEDTVTQRARLAAVGGRPMTLAEAPPQRLDAERSSVADEAGEADPVAHLGAEDAAAVVQDLAPAVIENR